MFVGALRATKLDASNLLKFERSKLERRSREDETALAKASRKHSEGRLTDDQLKEQRIAAEAMIDELRAERIRLEQARRQLNSAGLLMRQRN